MRLSSLHSPHLHFQLILAGYVSVILAVKGMPRSTFNSFSPDTRGTWWRYRGLGSTFNSFSPDTGRSWRPSAHSSRGSFNSFSPDTKHEVGRVAAPRLDAFQLILAGYLLRDPAAVPVLGQAFQLILAGYKSSGNRRS